MSKQKQERFTTTTPEKTDHNKPFVQIEEKLTQEQLEATAVGILRLN